MTAKDFTINIINNLVKMFPNTRVRYENHQLSNTHFVEVIPNEVYRLNEEFQKWEDETLFKFIEKYPDQNLCFISDDAIVGIENIEYETKGVLFDLPYSFNVKMVNNVQPISHIIVGQPTMVLSDITELSFNISKNSFLNNNGIIACIDSNSSVIEKVGESNFATAA